ncbi:MAG: hypothetical protein LBO65_06280 [Spirochaetaceae bacterium]|jgi:hypothetical protein|nr:hypothetical protein [Spirochaetaceae bacterium]
MEGYTMENRRGAFFNIEELRAIFPRLKRDEDALSAPERSFLYRVEKTLYQHLSVQEIESTLGGSIE